VIRLALRVRRAQSELVLAELLQLAPAGVEETDLQDDLVEYAIYGPPGELPLLPDLKAAAADALVEISTSEIPDDWSERWKDFHRPITIASPVPERVEALRVRAPWEQPALAAGTREIVIDPGQAFGTGAHATTRLCLEILLEMACASASRPALLDLGTGSGVLAIAAATLGYGPVLAVDYDPLSVAAAAQNAAVNGVQIEVERFDLRSDPWPTPHDGGYEVGLANLLGPLLLELAGRLARPPTHLVVSGLLAEEAEKISQAFAGRLGMTERLRLAGGEWAALWLYCADGEPSKENGVSVAARTIEQ
jgi:ribosomal protein L11 methyltransferase